MRDVPVLSEPKMFLKHILPILLLSYHDCYAFPLYAMSSNETSPFGGVPASLDTINPHPQRTLFDVVWSCVITAFICAWTSVYPNVPPQSQGWRPLKKMLAKTKLMFWAIVAPELVVVWAAQQWLAATEIRDTYNKSLKSGSSNHVLVGISDPLET